MALFFLLLVRRLLSSHDSFDLPQSLHPHYSCFFCSFPLSFSFSFGSASWPMSFSFARACILSMHSSFLLILSLNFCRSSCLAFAAGLLFCFKRCGCEYDPLNGHQLPCAQRKRKNGLKEDYIKRSSLPQNTKTACLKLHLHAEIAPARRNCLHAEMQTSLALGNRPTKIAKDLLQTLRILGKEGNTPEFARNSC